MHVKFRFGQWGAHRLTNRSLLVQLGHVQFTHCADGIWYGEDITVIEVLNPDTNLAYYLKPPICIEPDRENAKIQSFEWEMVAYMRYP